MAKYFRVSIKGALPGGEVWSVNPIYVMPTAAAIGPSEMEGILTAIDGVALPNELRTLMSGATIYNGFRVEAREADGTLEAVGERTKSTPITGGGTSAHPFQTCMVLSLRTPSASASAKGRLYWPATGALIDTTSLRATSTVRDNAVLGAKTFFVGIETAINSVAGFSDTAWSVWSQKLGSASVITRILAGDVLDVQRRRRDRLVENFSVATRP